MVLCSSGVAQGVVTGIRGLCTGLGPALFGFIFYLFDVDLNDHTADSKTAGIHAIPKNQESSVTIDSEHISPSNVSNTTRSCLDLCVALRL